MNLTEAITAAVKDCIRENILADFLKSNSSEVINMLTMEFDIDRARAVWMQEAKEEGFEAGRQEGHQVGLQVGHQESQQEDMQIVTALIARRDPNEIAKTLRLPVDRIIQWKNLLDQKGN
jgi:predicted transposase YdaD